MLAGRRPRHADRAVAACMPALIDRAEIPRRNFVELLRLARAAAHMAVRHVRMEPACRVAGAQ